MWLQKSCEEHGFFTVPIWSDPESYYTWENQGVHACPSLDQATDRTDCPFTCGLCPEHEGDTCTAIFHLTDRCNMKCKVCFAEGCQNTEPSLETIHHMYETCMAKTCPPTVQLSGGEPTLRKDLAEIVRMGKMMGVTHIQVNTNGLKLAADPTYAQELADAGTDLIYLQFDDVSDKTYEALRGRPLFEQKRQAIENCAKAGLGVLLVMTVYPGVNDTSLGDVLEFGKRYMPTVRGMHLQPVTHMGEFPNAKDVITIPNVLNALVQQSNGQIRYEDISPRKKAAAHCSFSSRFFLKNDGTFVSLKDTTPERIIEHETVDGFVVDAVKFTDTYWRAAKGCCGESDLSSALQNRIFAISGMHFQDAWNIDLARLKGCCVHVMTQEGLSVPFCAYYLTSATGDRLYCG